MAATAAKGSIGISLADLMGLLSVSRGAQFATLTALTDARLRKTGNPHGEVRKRSRVNVVINFGYARAVNRQRVREGGTGGFAAQPRQWGTRLPGLPFVTHKGRAYLECKIERALGHEYLAADGRVLSDDDVTPFLPPRRGSAEHQGVEREILLRDYAVDAIESIAFGGNSYFVLPPAGGGEGRPA